ncbi:MAG: ABC transporter ATP-binding protein [Candidatus Lokiarchaeota archaeon]|nr:ABC transporter ATP-binding protein [Candidatus Lokiarchaeota archaeon]
MNLERKKYKTYKTWLLHHLYKNIYLIVLVFIGIIIVTFTRTFIPIIIGEIVDDALIALDYDKFITLLIIVLVIYLIRNVLDYATMMTGHYLGLKTEQNMRQEFFETIQHKPLRYHDNAKAGDLQALATNDVRIINAMIAHGAFFFYPFFQVVITLILIFTTLDLRLALVCIPFVIFYIFFILRYRKKIAPFAAKRLRKHSNLAVVLQDSITGASVVRSFVAEGFERKKFKKAVNAFRDNSIGEYLVQAKYLPLLTLYISIGITAIFSILFVFQNTLTIGELAATNLLLITLVDPTNLIWWATNDMMSGFAACSRVFTSLSDGDTEDQKIENQFWPKDFKGKIEFRDVTFSYENGERNRSPVLKNLNFTIEPNQKVALVGPTGCGKTTIAKLLLLLYEPQQGSIFLDGKNIHDYPLADLRRKIGYIEQDIYLFSQTIYENIAFGNQIAGHDEILNIAKIAQVDDFVQNLSKGYNTIVGERGTRLSGGEKQRVAIARAFLTNPAILILDDSVSAIDSETEEKIGRAMEQIMKKRTTLIITHRLHTIRTADKILVLKHGRIIAEGNHSELFQSSEDYRRIFGKRVSLSDFKVNNTEEVP